MKLFARPAWMAVLACTLGLSLSGCADLATRVPNPLAKGNLNKDNLAGGSLGRATQLGSALTASGTVGHALIQDAVASLQANADMDLGGMVADDTSLASGYQIMAAGGPGGSGGMQNGGQGGGMLSRAARPGEAIRQAMKKHQERVRHLAKSKLEARKGATKVSERNVTVNDDGSRTITAKIEATNKQGTHKQSLQKVVDADGTVLDYVHDMERTGKDGRSVISHRERHTEADGSFTATFKMEITRKDGAKKTVEWTRNGSADGSETGEGKITRFDGSVVTISITKTADGTVTTRTTDSAAKVEAEIKTDELGTPSEATVTDTQTGQVVEKVDIADPEIVEASDS